MTTERERREWNEKIKNIRNKINYPIRKQKGSFGFLIIIFVLSFLVATISDQEKNFNSKHEIYPQPIIKTLGVEDLKKIFTLNVAQHITIDINQVYQVTKIRYDDWSYNENINLESQNSAFIILHLSIENISKQPVEYPDIYNLALKDSKSRIYPVLKINVKRIHSIPVESDPFTSLLLPNIKKQVILVFEINQDSKDFTLIKYDNSSSLFSQ